MHRALESHKAVVSGKNCTFGRISAKIGWKILHDLGRICGESLVEASEDRFAQSIASLFKNSTSDEIFELLELLAPDVLVEGKDLDLTDYKMVMLCMKELLMYNFSDFFSPLEAALKALASQVQADNKEAPSQS